MSTHGAKVSRTGFDISTTDPREFVFNSDYGTFKIYKQGSGSVSVSGWSSAGVNIAHGLSFVPLCLFFSEPNPGSNKWFIGAYRYSAGDADAGDIYVDTAQIGSFPNTYFGYSYVDATNLRIEFRNGGGTTRSVDYKYYIFAETAES